MEPDSDWQAAGAAVRERMSALKGTTAALPRKTGLSGTTVRCVVRGHRRASRARSLRSARRSAGRTVTCGRWPCGSR